MPEAERTPAPAAPVSAPPAPAAAPVGPAISREYGSGGLARFLRETSEESRAELVLDLQRQVGNQQVMRALELPRRPGATGRLMRFEAPVHEAAERRGLTSDAAGKKDPGGLSNEEASAAYLGNWMRDVNQVLVPMVSTMFDGGGKDLAFAALALMATQKFGRMITAEQLGFYIPAEHIDSPAGLHDDHDVLKPADAVPRTDQKVPGAEPRTPPYVTPQASLDPAAKVTGADKGGLFAVDQTGTMAYIRRTNEHIEKRLELAVVKGRNPEGLMHLGAALHSLEDLFAHSNWIEIALGRLLKDDPSLLGSLKDKDREVFAFSQTQDVVGADGTKSSRPALMTGSFTGADTKISLTSELTKFMAQPLRPPKSPAEAEQQERFVLSLLRTYESQLSQRPELRKGLKATLTGYGVPGSVADAALALPLSQLYELSSSIPALLPFITPAMVQDVKNQINVAMSKYVLQPAAKRVQAEGLNQQVADTSLIKGLRDQTKRKDQAVADLSATERTAMEKQAQTIGPSVDAQNQAAQQSARDHVTALQNTPERVVAGPTHSQLGKDHANSPFFGLAFAVASEAVRRIRVKVVAAWDERAGTATGPYDFEAFGTEGQAGKDAQRYTAIVAEEHAKVREGWRAKLTPEANLRAKAEAAAEQRMRAELGKRPGGKPAEDAAFAAAKQQARVRELYAVGRAERNAKADASLAYANRVVDQGGEGEPATEHGHPAKRFEPYDLAAMRKHSADQLRLAARGLAGVAGSPEQAAVVLGELRAAIGRLDLKDERVAAAEKAVGTGQAKADKLAKAAGTKELSEFAAELRALAGLVENTRAHAEREELNAKLVGLRDRTLKQLVEAPAAQRALASAALVIIDDQIAQTRPSYTVEQRQVLEGQRDLPEHKGAPDPLPQVTIDLGSASQAKDPGLDGTGRRAAALTALIEESRLLMNHPYEDSWWVPLVSGHVRKHSRQVLADIEARNEGYATFSRPGEARAAGHAH